jgi:hypothetical protein
MPIKACTAALGTNLAVDLGLPKHLQTAASAPKMSYMQYLHKLPTVCWAQNMLFDHKSTFFLSKNGRC